MYYLWFIDTGAKVIWVYLFYSMVICNIFLSANEMFLRFTFYRRLSSCLNVSKNNTMNLQKCYFRYREEEDKIDISFLFKVKDSIRQFNFSRNAKESLGSLLNRMESSIEKVNKKSNKKKGQELASNVEVLFFDDKNNKIPAESSCHDLFSWKSPVSLKIVENLYEVVFNAPWVINLSLPQSMLAGFPIYPETFSALYTDKNNSSFKWYKGLPINDKGNVISDIHIRWEQVGTGFTYTPTYKDIDMKLKLECVPGNSTTTGPAFETISKGVVNAGPGICPFEIRHKFTQTKLKEKSFRCVTYNILADLYCDSDHTRTVLHPYCPAYALHIDYRKQLIIKELLGYNADIMCLQEVDRKIFNHCLQSILSEDGLEGLFYKKGKEVAEGLACFFRKDRFSLLGQEQILLSDALKTNENLKDIWNGVKDNKSLLERLLDRSTVASATILQSIDAKNEIIIVGNTHLYFHPDADHIRLLQGGIFIYWINSLRRELINKNPQRRISLILCGDFNSVPSCGVYQLYTSGIAPNSLPDWKSNEAEAVTGLSLNQDTILTSACGTPEFTNFTVGFADCLDYIFYDPLVMTVEQVIPLPSLEELQEHTALPSVVFPSDHIALIADLKFIE